MYFINKSALDCIGAQKKFNNSNSIGLTKVRGEITYSQKKGSGTYGLLSAGDGKFKLFYLNSHLRNGTELFVNTREYKNDLIIVGAKHIGGSFRKNIYKKEHKSKFLPFLRINQSNVGIDYKIIRSHYHFPEYASYIKGYRVDTWNYYEKGRKLFSYINHRKLVRHRVAGSFLFTNLLEFMFSIRMLSWQEMYNDRQHLSIAINKRLFLLCLRVLKFMRKKMLVFIRPWYLTVIRNTLLNERGILPCYLPNQTPHFIVVHRCFSLFLACTKKLYKSYTLFFNFFLLYCLILQEVVLAGAKLDKELVPVSEASIYRSIRKRKIRSKIKPSRNLLPPIKKCN